jgi:hypothetical protein
MPTDGSGCGKRQERVMRLPEAIKVLRENTMACWWPNGPYPGKQGTDFSGIFGEVKALLHGIMARQDIPDDAPFFVLDDENPETALYNDLVGAVLTVRRCNGW